MDAPTKEDLLSRWEALAEALSPRRWLAPHWDVVRLARAVASLSARYNHEAASPVSSEAVLAARLAFFLPRDLFKVVPPLLELHAASGLPEGDRWRVLDLGAGLGASSFGAALLASVLGVERLEVIAVDVDDSALAWLERLAPPVARRLGVEIAPRTLRASFAENVLPGLGPAFDLVLVGLALGESGRLEDPAAAADWLIRWRDGALAPHGSLLLLEPALRERSRALQAVRDVLAARGEPVFSPCPPVARCPLLTRPRDWCHEVARVPLPEPLAALGRRAGLREQRLTWSQLVLRRDPLRLSVVAAERLEAASAGRLVSGPRRSKGKLERWACTESGSCVLQRLKRHAPPSDPLEEAPRGGWVGLPRDVGSRLRCEHPSAPRCWSPAVPGVQPEWNAP